MTEALKITSPDVEGEAGWRPSKDFTYRSGDRPLDGYTIKRGLGRGGFGEVYYALSDGGKEVALKLIQRHLDVELRGVGQCLNLKNPHLVTLYDVRYNNTGENWVVMEYMSGPSLQERLQKQNGPLPFEEGMHWLAGIASAIDYLHQHGIVHRDLKPGNVFGDADVVKLGDYGLSKFISASRRSGQTESVGTVHYMAPEISTGHYGISIDIYSAAVIAFEMLTGDVPFDGESAGEILMKHLTAEPLLGKLEEKYRPVFARALAKDPADRFQSVTALLEAVRAAHRGERMVDPPRPIGLVTPPPLPGYSPPQPTPVATPVAAPINVNRWREDLQTSLPPLPGTLKAKRRAFSDLLWSMFRGSAMAAVIPGIGFCSEMAFNPDGATNSLLYVWIAVVAAVASAGLLTFGRIWQMLRSDGVARRMGAGLFGAALGVAAMVFAAYVSAPVPDTMVKLVDDVGQPWWPSHGKSLPGLLVSQYSRDLIRFAVLFAVAFALPDWAMGMSVVRGKRFSLWRMIVAAAIGLAAGAFISPTHGLAFAAVMGLTSAIVQWVTPINTAVRSYGRLPPLRKPVRAYA